MSNLNKLIWLWLSLPLLSLACDAEPEPVAPEDTPPPKAAIASKTFLEGDENNTASFRVYLNKAATQEVSMAYQTLEGTAGEEIDFVPVKGTVTIPVGEIEAFIEVDIIADTIKEDDEVFTLRLANPENATIAISEATGTIRNDDEFLFIPADGYISPEVYAGYNLVWRDEFDGTELDLSIWDHKEGAGGWGNEESQHYTTRKENSFVENGNLVIVAREESYQGAPYTSARIVTRDQRSFMFGRIDIRAILPEGQGVWPALWMLGDNIGEVGWPACGEIDIMELVGHEPNVVHGTAHWGPQGQTFSFNKGQGYSLAQGKFSDQYHVFSIDWIPGAITWMVDDVPYFTLTSADVNGDYPFNQSFYFLFNIAVGGKWPGYPDATTQFPQQMVVDYVRVFQKK